MCCTTQLSTCREPSTIASSARRNGAFY